MCAKIEIEPTPRVYTFNVNGYSFKCSIDWKERIGLHPVDILIEELEECLGQLKQMPKFGVEKPFKLPPLAP